MPLAMHMANELLSIPVAVVTLVLAGAIVAAAAAAARRTLTPERLPLMGIVGAFVFAAQMINFTLPGMPGTSGHLGGGVLLAIALGPAAAIVTMAAILIVQCLLFQDGGLLALGCNIINMGVVPCLLGWGLYRVLLGQAARAKAWRQYLAAWAGCVLGVVAGAALVPVQAGVSGVLRVPVGDFLAVMIGVHLVIGLIEGLITFAVVAYLRRVRPAAIGLAGPDGAGRRFSPRAVGASLLATALLLAGVVSWFASSHADGLESALDRPYGQTDGALSEPSPAVTRATEFQAGLAPLPDYTRPSPGGDDGQAAEAAWPAVDGWGSLAGVVGTVVTLGVVYLASLAMRRRRPA